MQEPHEIHKRGVLRSPSAFALGAQWHIERAISRGKVDTKSDTRFSVLLMGVLGKGVRWMPRLKEAMKDAA